MNDSEKIAVYETQIEDMLHAIEERISEYDDGDKSEFEQGRHLAFLEMMDIIKTRHAMIHKVVEDE